MQTYFAKPSSWDMRTCLAFNTLNRNGLLSRVFAGSSRLGDGSLWYALMLLMPVGDGWSGAATAVRMALTGALGTAVYCLLKARIRRPRPCDTFAVCRTVEPLDRWSFPSGHTLHAVSFSLMACWAYPWLSVGLVPFAVIVSCSRMVLGLHYPTDVLWGVAIGLALGLGSNSLASFLSMS